MSVANGFANDGWLTLPHDRRSSARLFVISGEISDPPMISSSKVVATWRSASRSVCTYCFIVNATSAWPIRLLSAFQSILASQPAVA